MSGHPDKGGDHCLFTGMRQEYLVFKEWFKAHLVHVSDLTNLSARDRPAQLALPPPTRCEVTHIDKIAASYAASCGDGLPRQENGVQEVIKQEVGEQKVVEQEEVSAAEQTALEVQGEGAYGKRTQSEAEDEGETKEMAPQARQKHMALGSSAGSSAGLPDVAWYPVRVVEYAAAHKIKVKAKSPSFRGQSVCY